jgi:transposase IS116/IS110/IS902 family protein
VILGEVGDVRRFPSRHHFATYAGAAPIEVSAGEVERHRPSRAGNRRLNHALHIIALSNKRHDDRGGAYYAKKIAAGKGSKGALRCLKRRARRRRVPAAHRRPATAGAAEPGWAPGGDASIQRGRLTPQRRRFGAATHRAPRRPYARPPGRLLTQRGAVTGHRAVPVPDTNLMRWNTWLQQVVGVTAERDAALAEVLTGPDAPSHRELADEVGISRQRVDQLAKIAAAGGRPRSRALRRPR